MYPCFIRTLRLTSFSLAVLIKVYIDIFAILYRFWWFIFKTQQC
jgi:hypothetical protein